MNEIRKCHCTSYMQVHDEFNSIINKTEAKSKWSGEAYYVKGNTSGQTPWIVRSSTKALAILDTIQSKEPQSYLPYLLVSTWVHAGLWQRHVGLRDHSLLQYDGSWSYKHAEQGQCLSWMGLTWHKERKVNFPPLPCDSWYWGLAGDFCQRTLPKPYVRPGGRSTLQLPIQP